MQTLTRRGFVRTAAILAAGTAAGGMIWKGVKEYGPVPIQMCLFTKEPFSIRGDLLSDELRDVFQVRSSDKGKWMATAELKLSEVKKVVAAPNRKFCVEMTMRKASGSEKGLVNLVAREGTLAFWVSEKSEQESMPVWLMLEDVKRVL